MAWGGSENQIALLPHRGRAIFYKGMGIIDCGIGLAELVPTAAGGGT